MKRASFSYIVLALAFLCVVALAVSSDRQARAQLSFFSTYDTGPNGYRALYRVMGASGVPVMRYERPLGLLDPRIRTLVVSSNAGDRIAGRSQSELDAGDLQRLAHFVLHGGRLVVLESPIDPTFYKAFKLAHEASAKVKSQQRTELAPVAPVPVLSRVRSVVATSADLLPYGSASNAVPLLGTTAGIAALMRSYGKGEVIFIAAPSVMSNALIGGASNARFAYNVLHGHGLVGFDERLHGYAIDRSFWDALPMPVHLSLTIVLLMVVLWLIEGNVRSAPAVSLARPDERHSSSYVVAMAGLLRQARAGAAGIARMHDDAVRRAGRRADNAEIASAIGELARLRALATPHDDAVLRAARIAAHLRKDLG